MSNISRCGARTYSTTLVEAQQPLDISAFCELVAKKLIEEKTSLQTKEITHGQVHGTAQGHCFTDC